MKRLFSLTIIVIAALLFWGSQAWENKKAIIDIEASDPHYIDVFINDFTITAMNGEGLPAYTLKAKRLEHYNDSDFAIIKEPVIELKQNNQHWLISAKTGEINDNEQQIILKDNVVLLQQNKQQPIRMETEQLEIDTQQQIAKSTKTVRVIQQEFNLQSVGMTLNNVSGQLELHNSVEGSYVQAQ